MRIDMDTYKHAAFTSAKKALGTTVSWSGLSSKYRLHNAPRVKCLLYHGTPGFIQRDSVNEDQHINAKSFLKHLTHLSRHYNVIALEDYLKSLEDPDFDLPKNSVIITFDDGYASQYRYAYKHLCDFTMPATFFITTSFVFQKKPLWFDILNRIAFQNDPRSYRNILAQLDITSDSIPTDARSFRRLLRNFAQTVPLATLTKMITQLRKSSVLPHRLDPASHLQPLSPVALHQMSRNPLITIGAHTVNHPYLETEGNDIQVFELSESKRQLEHFLDMDISYLSYPSGSFSPQVITHSRNAGYRCGITTLEGFGARDNDPYQIRREAITCEGALGVFDCIVSGGWQALKRLIKLR